LGFGYGGMYRCRRFAKSKSGLCWLHDPEAIDYRHTAPQRWASRLLDLLPAMEHARAKEVRALIDLAAGMWDTQREPMREFLERKS